MRTMTTRTAVVLFGLIAVWLIWPAGCTDDDNPVKPPPDEEQYPIYFTASGMNGENGLCYQYYPATGAIDSFPLPVIPDRHMSVTADGKEIWITRYDSIYVFDIETKTVKKELVVAPGWSAAVFSPDNQLAALSRDGIYFINTHTYSIVFHDSAAGANTSGQFSTDGHRYYCGISGKYAYRVDFDRGTADTIYELVGGGLIQSVLPSLDENKLFIMTRFDVYTSAFFVYDISIDSIIYSVAITPQPARIVTSPYGKYVYLTAGGTLNSLDFAPFTFAIYDIQANDIIDEVKIKVPESIWPYYPMDIFVVTPDGRYLAGSSFFDEEYLPVYDLILNDTVAILHIDGKLFGHIECQTGL